MGAVIIIGASGHAKVVADIIRRSGNRIVGFLDDNPDIIGSTFIGFPVLGTTKDYGRYMENNEFIIAIGSGEARERIVRGMQNVVWHTAIHPNAVVSSMDVSIGEGTVVMAGVVINPGAKIGRHCIINSSSVIEHDNFIDDFSHVSVGAKIAGTVHIGKRSWIGIGAVISNNVNICSDCMIGAGTVVVKNINEAGTYIGVPAERRKHV